MQIPTISRDEHHKAQAHHGAQEELKQGTAHRLGAGLTQLKSLRAPLERAHFETWGFASRGTERGTAKPRGDRGAR